MQKYVFSGNEEWLKRIKEQYKDQVIVCSDYEKLLSLQKDENALIFTLHDHKHQVIFLHFGLKKFKNSLFTFFKKNI